jgi:flagellin
LISFFIKPALAVPDVASGVLGAKLEPYSDCHNADLTGVNAAGLDLTGINFSGANLTGATLTDTDLTGANFVGTNLTNSNFAGSNLIGLNLDSAILSGSNALEAHVAALRAQAEKLKQSKAYAPEITVAKIDALLSKIVDMRAMLEAFQNQLTSIISNLQTNITNASAAAGQVLDVDYAAETANLSRLQILQNASTALLAEANQKTQGVMQLLR